MALVAVRTTMVNVDENYTDSNSFWTSHKGQRKRHPFSRPDRIQAKPELDVDGLSE